MLKTIILNRYSEIYSKVGTEHEWTWAALPGLFFISEISTVLDLGPVEEGRPKSMVVMKNGKSYEVEESLSYIFDTIEHLQEVK